jgi:hypothetical protein
MTEINIKEEITNTLRAISSIKEMTLLIISMTNNLREIVEDSTDMESKQINFYERKL